MKPRWATVRIQPSRDDIHRMTVAAQQAVREIVTQQGCSRDHDAVNDHYLRRIYAAVVAGRRKRKAPK